MNTSCGMINLKQVTKIFLFLTFLFITNALIAQNEDDLGRQPKKIAGTVMGSDKSPLVGASIKIKGRNSGTKTDDRGNYTISASPIDTLIISYINYVTQNVRVGTKVNFQTILAESNSNLNEVIVVAYGSMKKKELTGVIGKVNMEDLRKAPVTSFDQALAGRVAGVVVSSNDGQPGGGSQIVIRGSTAGQDVSPLYVIDGFPVENMDLNSINPNDIESLEVLKDASSIAMYGSRGANGVIMITTKKGKTGPLRITYSESDGFQDITKMMKMLSPYQFVKLQLELDSMQSTTTSKVLTGYNRYIDTVKGINLDYYKHVAGYDWQKMLTQQGQLQTHNISITGGDVNNRISINGSYTGQRGVIINTGLKKYDAKFAWDNKFNDKVRLGATLNYSNSTSFGTIPTGGTGGGVVANMWNFRPVDILGAPSLNESTIDSSLAPGASQPDNLVNPFQQAMNEFRQNTTKTTSVNTYFEYSLTDFLKLRVTGGVSNTSLLSEVFYNSKTSQGTLALNSSGNPYNLKGINGQINNTNNNNYVTETTLSYKKRYDQNHVLDAVGGFTYQYGKTLGNGYSSINIPQASEYLGIYSLASGTATAPGFGGSQNQMYSYLGRINYSLMEKYIFTLTGREDGSSKFAPGHQWGFFPSGAVAWRFTQEPFFNKLTKYVTEGKLHLSYGIVGNNRVSDYSYLYEYGSLTTASGYPINNIYTQGIYPFFYGNPSVTWETTGQIDLGANFSLLKDRILIDVDYYDKNTKNSLLNVSLPAIAGYANGSNSQYENTGVIRNRGLEFTLTTSNIQTRKFTWTTTFNIAFNRNKIIRFYNNVNELQTGWNLYGSQTAWVAKVGNPISQFYGFKWGGVYQYSDFNQLANGTYVLKPNVPGLVPSNSAKPIQPGDPKYVDLNHDGVIDDNDRTIIGNPLPIHTGGFSNNFTYGNFSLNIFFQWSYGNQILNANKLVFESGGYYLNSNQFETEANHWTPTNPTNDIPRPQIGTVDAGGEARVSSRLVEDGSYLRLKTVSLGYSLPAQLTRRVNISALRFFLSVQNLLTFTNYSGLDPEVSTYRGPNPASVPSGVTGGNALAGVGYLYVQPSSGAAALAQGLDYTPYPRNRTVTIGAIVTF